MTEQLKLTEAEYRALPMPSYSLLKSMDTFGPRVIPKKLKFDSEAIDFGSLLDCRLFTPEEFDNKFYFDATEKPTGQVLELADTLLKYCDVNHISTKEFIDHPENVLNFANGLNLFGGVKDPVKRREKFDNDLFWDYINAKENAFGKVVFTPDMLSECDNAEVILKNHEKSAYLFNLPDHQESVYQLMLTVSIQDVDVKVMIDMAIIDHKEGTITPYDLKATESRQADFPHNFMKMRYYLQGSLYRHALIYHAFEKYLNYRVENFNFLVYSRSDQYPFVWTMNDQWHYNGLNGFVDESGKKRKGIFELVEDFRYYSMNEQYHMERCFVENNSLEL